MTVIHVPLNFLVKFFWKQIKDYFYFGNLFLGPSYASTYVHCSSFDDVQKKQICSDGQKVEVWDFADDKDSECISKCHAYASDYGPGCCELSEEGYCSYFVKGKVTEALVDTGSIKNSICTLRYDSGIFV